MSANPAKMPNRVHAKGNEARTYSTQSVPSHLQDGVAWQSLAPCRRSQASLA